MSRTSAAGRCRRSCCVIVGAQSLAAALPFPQARRAIPTIKTVLQLARTLPATAAGRPLSLYVSQVTARAARPPRFAGTRDGDDSKPNWVAAGCHTIQGVDPLGGHHQDDAASRSDGTVVILADLTPRQLLYLSASDVATHGFRDRAADVGSVKGVVGNVDEHRDLRVPADVLARCRMGSVLIRTRSPSVSTQVSCAWGCPPGISGTTEAKFGLSARAITKSSGGIRFSGCSSRPARSGRGQASLPARPGRAPPTAASTVAHRVSRFAARPRYGTDELRTGVVIARSWNSIPTGAPHATAWATVASTAGLSASWPTTPPSTPPP